MSSSLPKNVIVRCFEIAKRETKPLVNENDISRYIIEIMHRCDKYAEENFHMSPNQIGRCRGDWFEYAIKEVLSKFFKPDEFKVYPGRGHNIKEIKGFEEVEWIPMPDAIIKSPSDLRAVLSLKWGLRHDRMYEVGYEAYAIKDWIQRKRLNPIKLFLITANIFSGYESRLITMYACPVIDDIYFIRYERLSPRLRKHIKPVKKLIEDLREIIH